MRMLVFLLSAFLLIAGAVPVLADAHGQVVINEVAWMGSPVDEAAENQWWRYEWLELFNTGENPVSLNGWSIELRRENLDFAIPLAGGIPAKGYALVVSSGKIANSDINYANLGGKFFNGGQLVLLKDAQGIIQDEVDAQSGWFAGDNKSKQTMERTDPLKESSDPQNWHTSIVEGGTPRQENKKPASSAGAPTRRKKPDSSLRSAAILVPSHFILAVAIALGSAAGSVRLRRFLLKQAGGSSGGLED